MGHQGRVARGEWEMRTKVGGAVPGEPSAEMEGCRDEDPGGSWGEPGCDFPSSAPHPGTAPASTAGRPLWIQADGEQLRARTSPAHCIQLWPLSARDSQHELGGSWGIRARGSPHLAGGSRNHELGSSGRLRVRTLPSKPVCLPARRPAGRARTLEMFPQQLPGGPPRRAPAQP